MSAAPPHILVVDDDGRLRDLLRRFLTENGFRVSTAASRTRIARVEPTKCQWRVAGRACSRR